MSKEYLRIKDTKFNISEFPDNLDEDEQISRKNSKISKLSIIKRFRYNIKQDFLGLNNIQIPKEFENVQKSKSLFILNENPNIKKTKKINKKNKKLIRDRCSFQSQSQQSYSVILNVLKAKSSGTYKYKEIKEFKEENNEIEEDDKDI